jgi:hypothetical protein
MSPVYEIRKTAAFCIGNLVKNHRGNAEALGAAGGVAQLAAVLNDVEDDELSKRAFSALVQMEDVSLSVILGRVATLVRRLPIRVRTGGGGAREEGGAGGVGGGGGGGGGSGGRRYRAPASPPGRHGYDERNDSVFDDVWGTSLIGYDVCGGLGGLAGGEGGGGGADHPAQDGGVGGGGGGGHLDQIWAELNLLLPVANGLIYTAKSNREHLWRHPRGIEWLVSALTVALPWELYSIICFVLANVSMVRRGGERGGEEAEKRQRRVNTHTHTQAI